MSFQPGRGGLLHRKSDPTSARTRNSSIAPPIVHDVLRSPGQPLDSATRAFMEPRFGYDFSRVRVHTDAKAAESAAAVSAQAYTVGSNIVFGSGRGGAENKQLLAHELAHVVQQGGRHAGGSLQVAPANDSVEGAADRAAGHVLAGGHAAHSHERTCVFRPSSGGEQALQRQPKSSSAPDASTIDPNNLGTLGPDFHKQVSEVRRLSGLKEMRLTDSADDQDFVLFWAQNSTVPLRKLRPGSPVFATTRVIGEKTLVWAQLEGETEMFMGYVKSSFLLDTQVAEWSHRQKPLFSLTPPSLSPPSLSTQPPAASAEPQPKDSWDAITDPGKIPDIHMRGGLPAWMQTKVDDTTVWNLIGHALHKHDDSVLDALEDIEQQRDAFPYDPNLAAADHYLFARLLVRMGFPRVAVAAGTYAYGGMKQLGIVPSFKSNTVPTLDTPEQRKWGVWGAYELDDISPIEAAFGARTTTVKLQ
ncbi:MAG TPA: DUF4157 domain-containing protein [Opitutaceae bacterium]|nr:DUF4157 domain-containing protein [Opitutaceae bacterium]